MRIATERVMTVAQLIELLRLFPQDALVLSEGESVRFTSMVGAVGAVELLEFEQQPQTVTPGRIRKERELVLLADGSVVWADEVEESAPQLVAIQRHRAYQCGGWPATKRDFMQWGPRIAGSVSTLTVVESKKGE